MADKEKKRKADKLSGKGSFSDMLKRRRKAMEKGNPKKARRIGQKYKNGKDDKRKK